ncbi:MAG: hypothetical protein K6F41_07430 [Lachnospira sp.]|nr:hypothetical protein [Lachnospira sp.]
MKKRILRISMGVISVLTLVIGIVNFQMSVSKASYHDVAFRYTINTDDLEVTDVYTGSRTKDDDTSAYVYNRYSQSEITYIRVMASNSENGALFNETYGASKSCPVGEYRYLPNLVKEKGYSHAGLMFDPGNGHHNYISILWSPDSI